MGNRWLGGGGTLGMAVWAMCGVAVAAMPPQELELRKQKLREELKAYPHKIIFESYRGGNWELMLANADGSNLTNLTNTPGIDELYPHASPDGTRVVFLAEEGFGNDRTRNAYYMNIDGTNRVKVGEQSRQPFWSPDGRLIGYVRGTYIMRSESGRANKELYFYDTATGKTFPHVKTDISGLINPGFSPDSRWIIASACGGMGFGHSIVALEANGTKVYELARSHSEGGGIYQCRPDISPDGKHLAWGKLDANGRLGHGRRVMWVEVCDIDLDVLPLKITNKRFVFTVPSPYELYHVDWSPCARYIAVSRGPAGGRMSGARYIIGTTAVGWDIWVVDTTQPEVAIPLTVDGLSNKEADWVFVAPEKAVRKE